MAEGVCAKCSRYLLIVFNFLFWISGAAMLGLGIWLIVDPNSQDSIDKFNLPLPPEIRSTFSYVLIAVGSFIFITGFCGCCGAMRESAWMIAMYIGCVVIVLMAELVGGIYIAVERTHLEEMFKDYLMVEVKNYNTAGNVEIDFLQIQFDCCGADNYTNYMNSTYSRQRALQNTTINTPKDIWFIPDSCCSSRTTVKDILQEDERNMCLMEARTMVTNPTELRHEGCYEKAKSSIYGNITIIVGVVIGVAFLEIVGVIFAIILCRNRTEYWDWD